MKRVRQKETRQGTNLISTITPILPHRARQIKRARRLLWCPVDAVVHLFIDISSALVLGLVSERGRRWVSYPLEITAVRSIDTLWDIGAAFLACEDGGYCIGGWVWEGE